MGKDVMSQDELEAVGYDFWFEQNNDLISASGTYTAPDGFEAGWYDGKYSPDSDPDRIINRTLASASAHYRVYGEMARLREALQDIDKCISRIQAGRSKSETLTEIRGIVENALLAHEKVETKQPD